MSYQHTETNAKKPVFVEKSKINKRKRNLVKKAHELAVYGDLKVCLIIKDDRLNTMQEFTSHTDFTVGLI